MASPDEKTLAEGIVVPRRLGDYQLIRRIAVGGMAEVFEARRKDSQVVVKVLLPHLARDREFLRMFEHEAQLNASLEHPNLVRVRDVCTEGAEPYLVMDLVDGPSLSEVMVWLRDNQRILPAALTGFVVGELLMALAHVHEARDASGAALAIVHRDVTPQNVLLSRQGRVLLGDFGIARSNLRETRTRTGVIKGKLRYLAPEQVTSSATDARTDLYAVGLLLFELLTGEPYLVGDSDIDLLRAAEAAEPRAPSEAADVDPRLDEVVMRALRRFPEERYPNAEAFASELARVGRELGWSAGADDLATLLADFLATLPERPEPRRVLEHRRHGARLAALIGVVAIAATAAIAAAVWRPAPSLPAVASGATPADAVDSNPTPDREPEHPAEPTEPPAPASKPAPTVAAASTRAPPDDARVSQRLRELRASLGRRGILASDLPAADQAALGSVDQHLAAGRTAEAEAALGPLERRLEPLRVDDAFVRRKLDRVNGAIHAAKKRGVATGDLEGLQSAALQDYMAGRYEATNRRLNEILRRIPR